MLLKSKKNYFISDARAGTTSNPNIHIMSFLYCILSLLTLSSLYSYDTDDFSDRNLPCNPITVTDLNHTNPPIRCKRTLFHPSYPISNCAVSYRKRVRGMVMSFLPNPIAKVQLILNDMEFVFFFMEQKSVRRQLAAAHPSCEEIFHAQIK